MSKVDLQSVKQRFGIIGVSEVLNRAIDIAIQVAATDLSVLITGESGVGKERIPQIIHQFSARKHGQYIAVNCGAIPEGTIDSELFGHEKGSFTGAVADRKGYFEVADGGTIFLDEVGELPLSTQVRLLRVLETGEFIKVGSSKTQKTNVRIVAATNLNMPNAINNGQFREDLYYRLNTVPINIPPLRERKQDISLLFRKFAVDFSEKYRMPSIRLTDEARHLLCNYYWQGNVRQLKNITEQISIIESNREIGLETLKRYLPENEIGRTPALFGNQRQGGDAKSFNSEREILYQVLFDMKKDMNDLKKLVHDIINNSPVDTSFTASDERITSALVPYPEVNVQATSIKSPASYDDIDDFDEYKEVDEFYESPSVDTSNTLQDMEREMIRKSLLKHQGKRKAAADELQISERTLYRKIKEYKL